MGKTVEVTVGVLGVGDTVGIAVGDGEDAGAGGVILPIRAYWLKWDTMAVTELPLSALPGTVCHWDPSHRAIERLPAVTPAGKEAGLYCSVKAIGGLKFAPSGPKLKAVITAL